MRRLGVNALGGATCEYEEQADFSIDPFQQLCPCGSPNGLPQWSMRLFSWVESVGPLPTHPPRIPTFRVSSRWESADGQTPTSSRGRRASATTQGATSTSIPCQGIVRQEVFFGVTTAEGFLAREIRVSGVGAPLLPTFIDQGNSQRLGNARMNVRYRSNHILNLNL